MVGPDGPNSRQAHALQAALGQRQAATSSSVAAGEVAPGVPCSRQPEGKIGEKWWCQVSSRQQGHASFGRANGANTCPYRCLPITKIVGLTSGPKHEPQP